MKIESYRARTIIRTSHPSMFSHSEAYLNPYQGCYHDCVYCDGKAESYHMHEDYGTRIRVKKNAPELLKTFFLQKGFLKRHKPSNLTKFIPNAKIKDPPRVLMTVGGGVCDVYQPAEKEVRMTRKLLEMMYKYAIPINILTKNVLVLRDLDILKKINEQSHVSVNFTITHIDDDIQAIFEPNASSSSERFKAIKTLREEKIHSGIYFYPPLPFIGDTDENYSKMFKKAKDVGAEFVYCWGLTLKPGRSKNEYLKAIKKHFPELLPKYKLLYSNNNKYGIPDHKQIKKVGYIWPEMKAYSYNYEAGIPYTSTRYIPEGRIKNNLLLSAVLIKITYIKSCILQDKRSKELKALYKFSRFLETYNHDLAELENSELEMLTVGQDFLQKIIKNFIKDLKSQILEEIELKAYNKMKQKE
ncbi:MAG: radical SAM protein [Candidatus Hodarchaeales archaeon]|jgi:DNA repair photolyase